MSVLSPTTLLSFLKIVLTDWASSAIGVSSSRKGMTDFLNGKLISKPTSRDEAFAILQKLNGQKHQLISSVCISKNGSMIWNFTDASTLTMKQLNLDEIKSYLIRIKDKDLYAYGVYQIEADGRSLFSKIEGDENTIMGLPVKQIKEYLNTLK